MIYNSVYAGEQERLESEAEISRINPIGGGADFVNLTPFPITHATIILFIKAR